MTRRGGTCREASLCRVGRLGPHPSVHTSPHTTPQSRGLAGDRFLLRGVCKGMALCQRHRDGGLVSQPASSSTCLSPPHPPCLFTRPLAHPHPPPVFSSSPPSTRCSRGKEARRSNAAYENSAWGMRWQGEAGLINLQIPTTNHNRPGSMRASRAR